MVTCGDWRGGRCGSIAAEASAVYYHEAVAAARVGRHRGGTPSMNYLTRKPLYYGWVIVATLAVVSFSLHAVAIFSFGLFVLPMTAELGITRAAIGLAPTVRSLGAGVSVVVVGRLLDRYGARVLIPVAAVITALAMVGLSAADQYWQVMVLFTVIGLTGLTAGNNLMVTVPITKWFVRRRGRAISIAVAGLATGGVAFPIGHQALIDGIGWRATWVVSAAILVAIAVPLPLLFLRRTPEDMGLHPDGELPITRPDSAGSAVSGAEENWTARAALRAPTFWILAVSFALLNFTVMGLLIHRIPFWVERGFDPVTVAGSFSVNGAAFIIASLSVGGLLDRVPVRSVAIGGILLQAVALVWLLNSESVIALYGTGILFGAGLGSGAVVRGVIWATYFGRGSVGTIRGLVGPVELASNGVGPPMMGLIYDVTGAYTVAFWIAVALMLSSALLMSTARPPRRAPTAPVESAHA
jgi:sugar phosphate permease